MDDINRLKICLVEHKKTNKWLAEQVGKDPATGAELCTNTTQPDVVTRKKSAQLLDIDIRELLNRAKEQ